MAQAAPKDVVFKSTSTQTATLFFLHGLGDSAEGGWSEVVPEFQSALPFMKVILPNAPISPVTLNGGMRMPSWHDITSLSNLDKQDFKGLDASRTRLEGLIKNEIDAGIPSNRIILGGFSQGGAVALFTGLQYTETLGGMLALSTYLPFKPKEGSSTSFSSFAHSSNQETPILQCHGNADQVVAYAIGERSFETIVEARGGEKKNIQFNTYKNMGHHSSEQEMKDVVQWLKKELGNK